MNLQRACILLIAVTAAGCKDPFQIEVTNNTGAELTLRWDTVYAAGEEGETITDSVVIPEEGGVFDYTGQPVLNNRVDASVRAEGMFATGTRSIEGLHRDTVGQMTWGEDDITNFRLVINNRGANTFPEFYVKDVRDGTIGLDERPGENYGPIGPNDSVEVSLGTFPEGFDWVAFGDASIWEGNAPWDGMEAGVDVVVNID